MASSVTAPIFGGYAIAIAGAPTVNFSGTGGSLGNGNYQYAVTFVTPNGESAVGTASAAAGPGSLSGSAALTAIPTGPIYVTARKIYRTTAGGGTLSLLTTISDNTTTTYNDTAADGALGATAPAINTANSVTTVSGTFKTDSLVQATAATASVAGWAAITCHGSACALTFTGVTTAAATTATAVVTNRNVTSSSLVHASLQSYGGTWVTNGYPNVTVSAVANGSVTLQLTNLHAANALNGAIVVFISVVN